MTTLSWYRKSIANAFGSDSAGNAPNIDWLSDTIKVALLTSSYTPDLDAHDFYDDLTNQVANGNGYTTGGATLGSKTLTNTAANSWATAHATSTAYVAGKIVRPSTGNGYVYRCVVAGTSGGSAPTWPTTVGQTVSDGTVTWVCYGKAVTVFDAADPSWTSATFTCRYAVVYDDTPGTAGTKPLLWLIDFESDQSPSNGTFSIQFDSQGIAALGLP